MNYRFFIAKRYLLSKKEQGFITVISLISVVGITIGVAALVVVLSVFNGFNNLVTSLLVGFDPHLRVLMNRETDIDRRELIRKDIVNRSSVSGCGAFVSGKAMIISRNQTKVIFIRAIDPDAVARVSGVKEKMVLGEMEFENRSLRDIVIGLTLADRLGVVPGDSVYLVSPSGVKNALDGYGAPVIRSYRIAGIYESNNKEYDGLYAFMGLATGQQLLNLGRAIQGYEIRLGNIGEAEQLKSDLQQKYGNEIQTLTWYDLHKDLYSVMLIERWSAYIILCLIIGVATFNLLGSLTMTVIAKTRDIGILKAMGATNKDIVSIFRVEGLLVGIIGAIAGTLLGLLICVLQRQYHLFPLDPTVYIIPAIPVEIRLTDFLAIGGAAILLSYFATFIPSRRASDLLPSEAIRWE
jgi:lipoprotein-releasing system permease protein